VHGWIELHAFDGGYCGLSHVEPVSGRPRVNACWIAHEDTLRASGKSPQGMLDGALRQNPHLAERLDGMRRTTDFCATSQVTFALKGTDERGVCMVGDTVGMIAPMCGDGMAMALHGAALAAPLADDYLSGLATRADFDRAYGEVWRETFGQRLALSRHLHRAYTRPAVTRAALHGLRLFPSAGDWFIRKTRG
jgi:flavin-dependent dehydrogenase